MEDKLPKIDIRYWVSAYHVDGFRFDLASILTRDKNGVPMISPPLLDKIANDAILGKSILIAEAWDLDETQPGYCLSYMYAEEHSKYGTKKDAFIYIALNSHWEEHYFEFPILPNGFTWKLAFDSSGFSSDEGKEKKLENQQGTELGARSSIVLLGVKTK